LKLRIFVRRLKKTRITSKVMLRASTKGRSRVVVIMQEALVGLKRFLRPAGLSERAGRLMGSWIVAFVLHAGRMGAVRAAEAVASDSRHRAQMSRFLRRKFWVRRRPVDFLREALIGAGPQRGLFYLLIDSVLCSHQEGKWENGFSTGNRQRRPKKGRRYSKRTSKRKLCHCFVQGLLLLPNGVRVPLSKSFYTKAYSQKRKVAYRTQSQLAAELIRQVPVPEAAQVVVLADTSFDAKAVRQACAKRGFYWIVPANPERVLAGAKPRPKLRTLWQELKREGFQRVRLAAGQGEEALYQRTRPSGRRSSKRRARTFWVQGQRREVQSVGEVLLVFATGQEPKAGQGFAEEKILLSNHPKLSAEKVVKAYALRWQIELFFKELKSGLGFHQYRFSDFQAVEAWVELAHAAFMYLEHCRLRQLARKDLSDHERARWQWQRTHGLAKAIRQQTMAADLKAIAQKLQSRQGLAKLKRQLANAIQSEYRIAA
jgi:hypothetical protein